LDCQLAVDLDGAVADPDDECRLLLGNEDLSGEFDNRTGFP
jgi:hypothetical protein